MVGHHPHGLPARVEKSEYPLDQTVDLSVELPGKSGPQCVAERVDVAALQPAPRRMGERRIKRARSEYLVPALFHGGAEVGRVGRLAILLQPGFELLAQLLTDDSIGNW